MDETSITKPQARSKLSWTGAMIENQKYVQICKTYSNGGAGFEWTWIGFWANKEKQRHNVSLIICVYFICWATNVLFSANVADPAQAELPGIPDTRETYCSEVSPQSLHLTPRGIRPNRVHSSSPEYQQRLYVIGSLPQMQKKSFRSFRRHLLNIYIKIVTVRNVNLDSDCK